MLNIPIAPGIFAKGRASNRSGTGVTSLPILGACEYLAGIDGEAVSNNSTLSGEN